jgi:hypothetical protein
MFVLSVLTNSSELVQLSSHWWVAGLNPARVATKKTWNTGFLEIPVFAFKVGFGWLKLKVNQMSKFSNLEQVL